MNANGLLQQAMDKAEEIIDEMDNSDQAQIITADKKLTLLTELTSNISELSSSINVVRAGTTRLDYGEMVSSINGLLDDYNSNVMLHVISDFQSSGMPARFADIIPGSNSGYAVDITLHPLTEEILANWSIDFVRQNQGNIQVGVRSHHTEAITKTVTLNLNGAAAGTQPLDIPGSSLAIAEFSGLNLEKGDNELEVIISPEDDLSGDDRRFYVISNSEPAPVLLITSNPRSNATVYLTTALETGSYDVEAVTVTELDPRILSRYSWVIIEDLGSVNETLAGLLRTYLDNGNAVVAAVGDQAAAMSTLPITGHVTSSAITSAGRGQFTNISRIDSSHPVLSNTTGWRGINISRTLELETFDDDRVLITLEDNKPFLLEKSFNQGRLILLTSSLDNTWSDLPVHPVFVTFISELARYLGNEDLQDREYNAGETLLMKQSGAGAGQVINPQGETILSLQDTVSGQDVVLSDIGFYQVITSDRESLVAVNPDNRESATDKMVNEVMDRWRNASGTAQIIQAQSFTEEAEPVTLELWHALLVILALLALLESLLGNHYIGYRSGV